MSNQKPLAIPSPALVSTYITQFEQSPDTAASDQAISKAFHTFPRNDQLEEILLRVAVLKGNPSGLQAILWPHRLSHQADR